MSQCHSRKFAYALKPSVDKVLVLIRIVENLEERNNRNSEREGYSLPGEEISHGLLICEIGCSNNSL